MKLYYSPAACSLAPHIILREANLPFTLHKVDIATHLTKDQKDYYTINPKGQVPLLELEDGQVLSEGPIITQYIADHGHNADLIPAFSSMERYRVLEWQNYITSELHKAFSQLFNPEIDANSKSIITTNLHKKFAWVSTQLKGKKYLTGDKFTIADAYLFAVSGWAKFVNLDLSSLQELQDFLSAVKERPHVMAAMKEEGLL